VFAARVEASFLTLLGVRPAHGRLFVAGEDRPGRDRVIVLGDGLWRRSFGADPAVVGRALMVNGAAHTVVGVLPPEFAFDYWSAEPIEMYVPFPMNPTYTSRSAEFASVRRVAAVARLKPRLSLQDASSELQAISQALTKEHPGLYRRGSDGQELGFFMDVRPLKDAVSAQSRPIVMLLFGGVGLVLLIACVNTVQFLLAQSIEREGEVAIRRALGAGRSRLVRQFLSEALLLAGAAAGVGLVQAAWLMKGLAAILPAGARVAGSLTVDLPVLVFTACTAMIATMACGIAPALHLSRSNRGLRREGSGTPPARSRSRQVLIAVEVAVSMVLLVGASVLVHSLRQLYNAPAGYSAEDVTVMRIRQPPRNVAPIGSVMYQRYLERIVEIPGVESAAVAAAPLPFYPATDFAIEGRPDDAAALSRQLASYLIVSPGYFSALRIPLRDGRIFAEDDIVGRPAVAIVNEEMARRFWPGESAVGRRIRAGQGPRAANLTIVGVVGNVRPVLQTGAVPQIYVSYLQQNEPSISLLVRRAPGATVSPDAVKQAVWSIAPDQPLFDIRPMTAIVSQLSAAPRTVALLLGSFALLALFMSATGVYTVVSYLMSQRTREIALRRAIGAGARDVLGLLAGQTFRWTFIGLVTGVAGAFAGSGALRAAVPGVVQVDPAAVLLVGAAYLAIVALAMCLPALKALRVDPAAVLRTE
jgi:putative ABC transport system permease protein